MTPLRATAALCVVFFAVSRPACLGLEETQGKFALRVGPSGECRLSYEAKPVIVQETPIVPDQTWKSLFPTKETTLQVNRSEDAGAKMVTVERDLPSVARYKKVVCLFEDHADFDLDFVLCPNVAGARQMQWFVHLPLQQGKSFVAESYDGSTQKGVLSPADVAPVLVAGNFYRITLPTEAGEMAFDFSQGGSGWHLDDYVHGWAKRFIFYNHLDLTDAHRKGGVHRRLGFRVFSADRPAPAAQFTPVDLSAACNRGFQDDVKGDEKGGWTDEGDADLRRFPVGRQVFYGVPFNIVDPAKNSGKSCVVLRGRAWKGYPSKQFLPEQASIPVGKKARTIYFLHTCAWPCSPEVVAASYLIRYEGGVEERIPLHCGFEVADWCRNVEGDRCMVAWRGVTDSGLEVGANLHYWENTHPDRAIESMVFQSANQSAAPILLGVTLSDAPPRLQGAGMDTTLLNPPDKTWFPFHCPPAQANTGATDVSFLIEKPAGKHGFVTAADGRLRFEDGTRARFWGQNIDFGGRTMRIGLTHQESEVVAAYLARSGNNIVRLHCLDTGYSDEKGYLFSRRHNDSSHFDDEVLDNLDYLIAQLKKNGVYITIDLWGFRRFVEGDKVRDWQEWQKGRATSMQTGPIINQRQHEIEKEYARALLTHKNPYTGLALVDDPVLAMVSLFNEVALFQRWPWSNMPPSYIEELTSHWSEWLLKRYPTRDALAAAWTDAQGRCALDPEEDPAKRNVKPFLDLGQTAAPNRKEADARVNESILFLHEIEKRHSLAMRDFLRSIGLKAPIAVTGDLGATKPAMLGAAVLEVMDQHTYWDHPQDWKTWKHYNISQIGMSPFAKTGRNPVRDCGLSNVGRTAASAISGKPLINTEWNVPWPNQYRAEGPLFMAAYGCLQEWDGLILYALQPIAEGSRRWREPGIVPFDILHDPAREATWQAAAMMFLRGDVRPAQRSVDIGISDTDAFWGRFSCVTSGQDSHTLCNAPLRFLPYLCRVRSSLFQESYSGRADAVIASGLSFPNGYAGAGRALLVYGNPATDLAGRRIARREDLAAKPGQKIAVLPDDPNQDTMWLYNAFVDAMKGWGLDWPGLGKPGQFVSDTGELVWDYENGVLQFNTPMSQGAVGFLGKVERYEFPALKIETKAPFGAIVLSSLTPKPISASSRLLLSVGADAANTGERVRDLRLQRLVLVRGEAPPLAEPVQAAVQIAGAGAVRLHALDPAGNRAKALAPKSAEGGWARFDLDSSDQTIYYEVERQNE